MALTTENVGATLVSGLRSTPAEAKQMRRCRILQPFRYQRQTLRPGMVIDLPGLFAIEMVAMRRAEYFVEPPPEPPAPEPPRKSTRFGKGGVPPEAMK